MVGPTAGAVVLMEAVLAWFHGEDGAFNKVSLTDAVDGAVEAGLQPTMLDDIDGLGLHPVRDIVGFLSPSSLWLVGAGLVLGGLYASDAALLTVGWADGTGLPLSSFRFQSCEPIERA